MKNVNLNNESTKSSSIEETKAKDTNILARSFSPASSSIGEINKSKKRRRERSRSTAEPEIIIKGVNEPGFNTAETAHKIHLATSEISLMPKISCPSDFSIIDLKQALDSVRDGTYKHLITTVREAAAINDTNEKSRLKDLLPSWATAGTFNKKVASENFKTFSHVIAVDIDKLGDVTEAFNLFKNDPSVVFAFLSPSGDGLKVGYFIDKVINDGNDYKNAINRLFKFIGSKYPSVIDYVDRQCINVNRAVFVSYDPDIYVNYGAKPLDLSGIVLDQAAFQLKTIARSSAPINPIRVEAALKFVTDYEYGNWFLISAALNHGLGEDGFVIFHSWSKRDIQTYKSEEDCRNHYYSANRREGTVVTCATIFMQAKKSGWPGTIDVKTALDHTEDSNDYKAITYQVAAMAISGLPSIDLPELIDAIISRGKLGHVKTLLLADINNAARGLFNKRPQTPLDQVYLITDLLPKDLFPDGTLLKTGVKLKSTDNNLRLLMEAYGITCSYDVLLKEQSIKIPNTNSCKTLENNANISKIRSLCALNDLDKNVAEHLPTIFSENIINPVQDWIDSKPWDSVDRLPIFYKTVTVHSEYNKVKDQILLTWLLQTVAACDNGERSPNDQKVLKFEYVLTLQGCQGAAKSSWIKKLLPRELGSYVKTSVLLTLSDKDSRKAALSCLICELGELDSTFRKSDIAELKAFLTADMDEIRLPYERGPNKYERRTSFIASVNSNDFLHDQTGNRRYLTLGVKCLDQHHKVDMQQLWAQVYQLYLSGEQWWPDEKLDKLVSIGNENHLDRHPAIDLLERAFDLSKPNKGEKQFMHSLKNTMGTTQSQDIVQIDISSPTVSRIVKAHLESKGFREKRRVWTITHYSDGGQLPPRWPIYS
jgi:hypothetical protein